MKKVVRTISGITPLAVMLKPWKCPGNCIYCPNDSTVPKSYTPTSPVVLRAIDCDYDPKKQVEARLKIMKLMGHITNKIELIVMGGTFSFYPLDYQRDFIKGCFDGMIGWVSKTLEKAQKMNEIFEHRCIGMCLETRPDYCKKEHVHNFLEYGGTRVEIGVQTLDDKIYELTKRGHTVQDVIDSTQLLKDSCFKVGYHMMLGLPGSDPDKDIENFKMIFSDQRFQPDHLKIYPTFVIKGTELEKMYYDKKYEPYSTEEIVEIITKIKKFVPDHVRVMRVMRDLPAQYIVSECIYSHLRDEIQKRMKESGLKCRCIRCREAGHAMRRGVEIKTEDIKMKRKDYDASNGREIFLSFEDEKNDVLVSLIRLRIPYKPFRLEIGERTGLIREIHTYGPQVPINDMPKQEWQHRGYGKLLLEEAEKIAKEEFDCHKMIIISGVGVRPYFYKFGYKLDGPFVSKEI